MEFFKNERLKRKGSPTATFLPEAPLRGKSWKRGAKKLLCIVQRCVIAEPSLLFCSLLSS